MKRIAVPVLLVSLLFITACLYGIVPSFPDSHRLGTVWHENEGKWDGVWTRRGYSNVFDGVWVREGTRVTGVLSIRIQGNYVTVIRHNRDGMEFRYSGILSGDGMTVSGTMSGGPNYEVPWSATITGYR